MKRGIKSWAVAGALCFGSIFCLGGSALLGVDCDDCDNLVVNGPSTLNGDFRVYGEFHTKGGWASVDGSDLWLEKGLGVRGDSRMDGALRVYGETHLKGWASVDNSPLVLGQGLEMSDGMLNLTPQDSGLPPNAQNGDIFVRRYYANDDHEWRDDIAAYLQGQWRRVLTTNDWHDNPIVNGNALATADLEVSTPVKIECSGQSVLSKGTAIIPFDEVFANSADETKPIIVLVTPTDAACKGIAVVKTGINEQYNGETVSGFCALELNGGRSDATFNWQAIATRKQARE